MKLNPIQFPKLDIPSLQTIAAKWVNDYGRNGVHVKHITLHPMGMPIFLADHLAPWKRPKYAVIFHCPDCKRQDLPSVKDSAEEHLRKMLNNEFSPYTNLFLDLENRSENLFYIHNDLFRSVYKELDSENWQAEWRFVLKYQEATVAADIIQEAGVLLYPDEKKDPHQVQTDGAVALSDGLTKIVECIKTIGCKKITNDEVVQLLEKNGIRYDYPKMTKSEVKATVSRLRENWISNRIIALILEWPRIRSRAVKLESVIRRLPR